MTMEEAIQQLDGAEMMVLNREITQFNQAIIMAISALHTQQKQANECTKCQSDKIRHKQESVHNDPLVLDELRQMRGEPVWCKELECYGIVKMEKVGRWANELFLVGTCGCASVSAAIPLSCPLQICYEPIVQNHAAVFGILPLPPSLI